MVASIKSVEGTLCVSTAKDMFPMTSVGMKDASAMSASLNPFLYRGS